MRLMNSSRLAGALLLALAVQACSDSSVVAPNAIETASASFNAIPGVPDFLAPLGNGLADPATFDVNAADRVQVCTWVGGVCAGSPIAQFSVMPTGTTPSGSELPLDINMSAGRYEATLNLMSTTFLTRKTYRIAAMKGTTVLSSVLVDIVRGRWALSRTDGTLAPLKSAASLPIQFYIALAKPPSIRINEVESSGGTPGDWVELINTGSTNVDLTGFVIKDNNDTHIFTIASGTMIAPSQTIAFDVDVNYGLGAADMARVFSASGVLLDSYSWTSHAATTYGRCPDGTGAFTTMTTTTKGAANICAPTTPTGPVTETWPGLDNAVAVDATGTFSSNASGLIYEAGTGGATDVLWVAQNGIGSIHRLLFNGTVWARDMNNGWAVGKKTHYMDGTGEPDTEDLTFTTGSAAGMYIASERNNQASSVSRPSILRYDLGAAGSASDLTATNEWVLTGDLPVVAANSGLEGITFVPDAILIAQGFYDNAKSKTYNPNDYANHAGGLFFVGLEGNGVIYVYALDHVANTFTRITSIATGFPSGVMAVSFDRELGQLWATCDDTCGGLSNIYVIDQTPASPTRGQLKLTHTFTRPSTLPNVNNEGFAFAPQSACVNGFKPAFWADDNATGGFSIRKAAIPCVKFP